jgi:hypothetical protein
MPQANSGAAFQACVLESRTGIAVSAIASLTMLCLAQVKLQVLSVSKRLIQDITTAIFEENQ